MQNNPEKNYFQIATFKATDKHSRNLQSVTLKMSAEKHETEIK